MMQQYEPLFLKYRPQSLADLVGQEYVRRTLSNAIESNRISHAYLFTGPRGTGKTSSARILAKCLNCEKGPTPSPCQVCTACLEIKQGISPSVLEIDAASNNSVDDARVLIERAPLVAPGGRYKLYIIDECHMLTKEAFNALLKTIEEPPANVIFVLATTEEHKVPQTIVSRCQKLIFRLVNPNEMAAYLVKIAGQEAIKIESLAVDLIARRSSGGMRDALGLLDQASLLRPSSEPISIQDLTLLLGALEEDVLLAMGKNVLAQDSRATLELAHQLINAGKEPYIIASDLAKHMLNLVKAAYLSTASTQSSSSQMMTKTSPVSGSLTASLSGSQPYIESLVEAASGLDRCELAQMVEQLDRLEQSCKRASQPVLSLEIGLLCLCHRLESKALVNIEQRLVALEMALPVAHSNESLSTQALKQEKEKVTRSDNPASESDSTSVEHSGNSKVDATVKQSSAKLEADHSLSQEMHDTVNIEAKTTQPPQESPIGSQENLTDQDLDAVWVDLLEELQNRHLPTFSLVSTHAFPVSLTKDEFILGVHFENFQKMIDNKLIYVNEACQSVLKRTLQVKIRVVSKSKGQSRPTRLPTRQSSRESSAQASEAGEERQAGSKFASFSPGENGGVEAKLTNQDKEEDQRSGQSASGEVSVENPVMKIETAHGINITQEAYSLFEGPGSRLITANAIEAKDLQS